MERLRHLTDAETFTEMRLTASGLASGPFDAAVDPGSYDGVMVGTGLINGTPAVVFAQDAGYRGGSIGTFHGATIVAAQEHALTKRLPIIGIWDGGGARLQDGVHALTAVGNVFRNNVIARGVIPQISLVLGPCAGAACYSPALTDFLIITENNAKMFLTGPAVTKDFIGEETTIDELGGAHVHSHNGVADIVAPDDDAAISAARQLLSYLHPVSSPVILREAAGSRPLQQSMDSATPAQSAYAQNDNGALIPEASNQPYDVHQVLNSIFDAGTFLELQPEYAPNLITGFARLNDRPVALVASQPKVLAGTLDADACEKAARFITTSASFNIPIITFVDVPGFLPGIAQERAGIIRHGANLVSAYVNANVPKFTIIMRKGYGGAYIALDSMALGASEVFAWPTAEISIMGAAGAVDVLHHRTLAKLPATEAAQKRAQLIREFENDNPGLRAALSSGQITQIILPAATREVLIDTLGLRDSATASLAFVAQNDGSGALPLLR